MGSTDDVQARITDLELRFMRLERFANELSDAVAQQQKIIDALAAHVRRLTERSVDSEENPRAEPPPHY
jgi:uncharacterized coiled-coil protein SlyX